MQGIEDTVATCIRHCADIYGFSADDAMTHIRLVLPPLHQNWIDVSAPPTPTAPPTPIVNCDYTLTLLEGNRDKNEKERASDDPAAGIVPPLLRQNWDNVTIRDKNKKERASDDDAWEEAINTLDDPAAGIHRPRRSTRLNPTIPFIPPTPILVRTESRAKT